MSKKLLAPLVVVAILAVSFLPFRSTQAAALTAMKDTMSRIQVSQQGTHTFSFTTATSLTAGQTINILFDSAGDAFTLDGTIADTDFSGASGLTFVANVGACGGGASNEVYPSVDASAPGESYTLTVCTSDTVTAGAIAFTIDNNEITNPSGANTYKIDITTTSDSGSFAVVIITDDTVDVSATVDPSVTFAISDISIGFGVLSAAQECWAEGTPPASCNSTKQVAHTFSAGTNATGGVSVTYNGATLTSGANTIDVADINGDSDGTPGTEQFAIAVDDNGSVFTIPADYDEGSDNYRFIASTTTQLFSTSGPVASSNLDAHYIANIAANTQSGTYNTSITYIATGTF